MKKTIHATEYRELIGWLSKKRNEQGLTIRDLAERLEWHHSVLGRVETFERRLDLLEYMDICDALDCKPLEGLTLIEKSRNKSGRG